jgi:hypothetical protein
MTALHTTRQVADALGLSVQRVKQLAVSLEVGQKVGRDWVFTDADIALMRRRETKPGRPLPTASGSAPRQSAS